MTKYFGVVFKSNGNMEQEKDKQIETLLPVMRLLLRSVESAEAVWTMKSPVEFFLEVL